MKKFWKSLELSVLAGVAIAIGGIIFLNIRHYFNNVVACYSFSVGLILVLTCGLWLFTGKIGYVFEKKFSFLDFIIMFFGNLLGAVLIGYLCRLILPSILIDINAKSTIEKIENFQVWSLLLNGALCGVFVYLAVESYRYKKIPLALRILMVIAFIGTFVLLKLNHCIANMFYISFANAWSWRAVLFIVIDTIANALGAILCNTIKNIIVLLIKKNKTKKEEPKCE